MWNKVAKIEDNPSFSAQVDLSKHIIANDLQVYQSLQVYMSLHFTYPWSGHSDAVSITHDTCPRYQWDKAHRVSYYNIFEIFYIHLQNIISKLQVKDGRIEHLIIDATCKICYAWSPKALY